MSPQHLIITYDTEFIEVSPGVCLFWAFDKIIKRMVRYRSISFGDSVTFECL